MDMFNLALENKLSMLFFDLLSAGMGLAMLLACMLIGAKILRINLYAAIDKVENCPIAYAIFVTGHFYAAAYLLGCAFTV